MLEARKHLSRDEFLAGPGDEPMIQEDRRARVPKASETHLGLPEPSFEVLPVLLVGSLDVDAFFGEALEDKVLDQVRSCQLCASRIQCLEDLLRVLVRG